MLTRKKNAPTDLTKTLWLVLDILREIVQLCFFSS